jgi:hypothetical protein
MTVGEPAGRRRLTVRRRHLPFVAESLPFVALSRRTMSLGQDNAPRPGQLSACSARRPRAGPVAYVATTDRDSCPARTQQGRGRDAQDSRRRLTRSLGERPARRISRRGDSGETGGAKLARTRKALRRRHAADRAIDGRAARGGPRCRCFRRRGWFPPTSVARISAPARRAKKQPHLAHDETAHPTFGTTPRCGSGPRRWCRTPHGRCGIGHRRPPWMRCPQIWLFAAPDDPTVSCESLSRSQ